MRIMNVADIIEENGKTIRENNKAKTHNIPVNTMVEFHLEDLDENGAGYNAKVKGYVYQHTRDCDGTPLYSISLVHPSKLLGVSEDSGVGVVMRIDRHSNWFFLKKEMEIQWLNKICNGYTEDALTVVTPKQEV